MAFSTFLNSAKCFIIKQLQLILKLSVAVSIVYLILVNVSLLTLFIFGLTIISSTILIKLKIKHWKQNGGIDNLNPKLKALLLQKSIFDIYSDMLYFPTITKVIGAFLKPAISKPHPQQLKKSFQNIPQRARQVISTKGLIHLLPRSIQQLAYKQGQIIQPTKANDWSWYNRQTYKLHDQVHEQTMSKHIMQTIDQKLSWHSLIFMGLIIAYGIRTMNPTRAKRMLIQNGCFTGIILLIVVALVKLKKRNSQNQIKKFPHFAIQARIVQSQ